MTETDYLTINDDLNRRQASIDIRLDSISKKLISKAKFIAGKMNNINIDQTAWRKLNDEKLLIEEIALAIQSVRSFHEVVQTTLNGIHKDYLASAVDGGELKEKIKMQSDTIEILMQREEKWLDVIKTKGYGAN